MTRGEYSAPMAKHLGWTLVWLLLISVGACHPSFESAGGGQNADVELDTDAKDEAPVDAVPVAAAASPSLQAAASPSLQAAFVRARQREGGADYALQPLVAEDVVATARCAGQGMSSSFSATAVTATLDGSDAFSLQLTGVGRGAHLDAPEQAAAPTIDGAEIRYPRGEITEWYLNGPLGLEQGFVVHERPSGDDELGIAVTFAGVTPELRGGRVALMNAEGMPRAWYGALHVTDADGQVVPSHFEVDEQRVVLRIDDTAASYPLDIDPLVWTEQKLLLSSDIGTDHCFGCAVAISGDTAIVGAGGANAAYIFMRDQGGTDNWGEVKKISGPVASSGFGSSVDISGDLAIVGAPTYNSLQGRAYIFNRNQGGANNWGLMANGTKTGQAVGDFFGNAVSVSGSFAMVGARWKDNKEGAVYFYERSDHATDDWGIKEIRKASPTPAADEEFGFSVSIGGNYAVIGSWDGGDRGAAYVHSKDEPYAEGWGWVVTLNPATLTNSSSFGYSVSMGIDTAIVGAPGTEEAYVFSRTEDPGWGQVGRLSAAGSGEFGWSVSMFSNSRAVVGGYLTAGGGAAYVFSSDNWSALDRTLTASNAQSGDGFGWKVAIASDVILVGARFEDSGGSNAGATYVFQEKLENGDDCSTGFDCVSGNCVDGVCCNTACGSGVDDCQVCDATPGTCTFLTTECRASEGPCDPAEVCTGSSGTCPADDKEPAGTVCNPSTGLCDPEEICNGTDAACPADELEADGTECRAAAGDCDAPETCDGVSAACPDDDKEPAGTLCRSAAGACDVEETCDGTSDDCPADVVAPADTLCRAAAGVCDVEEVCDGTAAACPADVLASIDTACRPGATDCDLPETCNSVDVDCPSDDLAPDGTVCNDGDGTCANGSCVPDTAGPGSSGAGGGGDEPVVVDDGCGCHVVGDPAPRPSAAWCLLALPLVMRRRRRT